MFKQEDFLQGYKKFFLFLAFLSLVFVFSNFFEIQNNIVNYFNYVSKPVDSAAFSSSKSVKNFLGVFSEVRTLRNEYYDLKEEYLEIKAENNMLSLLKEENLTLKEQLGVYEESEDLILADVLFQDWALRNESLIINKGSNDSLKQGDVALVGDMYVGLLTEVHENISKVRLPTSRASSLRVMILSSESELEGGESFVPGNFLSGIAIGQSNVLSVENIEMLGSLEKGDVILVNDTKVGFHLYLGNVLTIDEDPTATFRNCTVEIPVDYSNLKRVFIKKGE